MVKNTEWKELAKYWHKYAMITSKALRGEMDFVEFIIDNDEKLMDIIDEQREELLKK